MRGSEKDRPLKTLEAEQDDRDQHATRGEQNFKPLNNDGLTFAMIQKIVFGYIECRNWKEINTLC